MHWEIALVATIFEGLSLIYIFRRNKYIDYYFGLFFIPFFVQQLCQCLILALDVNKEINNCGVLNQVYSNVILIFIYTIPLFVCFIAFKTNMLDSFDTFWKLFFIVEFILYLVFTTMALYDDYNCSYIGEYGYLSLQFIFYSQFSYKILHENVLEFILIIYYFLPFMLSYVLYKPLWILFIPYSYLLIMFVILRIIYKYESYSIWCLSSVVVCCWMILYVPITRYLINRGYFKYNFDSYYGGSRLKKIFLNKSYSQLIAFEMVNRNEIMSSEDDDYTANEQEIIPFQP